MGAWNGERNRSSGREVRTCEASIMIRTAARRRPFTQVDVFSAVPYAGNPVAVVLDAAGVSDADMARFAAWTNLSETTFVLPATEPAADYRLRIFTTGSELPFAGHPTLGSAHAWLEAGGTPKDGRSPVQQCGIGLVTIQQGADGLAFAARRGYEAVRSSRRNSRAPWRYCAYVRMTSWTPSGSTTVRAGWPCC